MPPPSSIPGAAQHNITPTAGCSRPQVVIGQPLTTPTCPAESAEDLTAAVEQLHTSYQRALLALAAEHGMNLMVV